MKKNIFVGIISLCAVHFADGESIPFAELASEKSCSLSGYIWDVQLPHVREITSDTEFKEGGSNLVEQTFVMSVLAEPLINAVGEVVTVVNVEETTYQILYVVEGNRRRCIGKRFSQERPSTNYSERIVCSYGARPNASVMQPPFAFISSGVFRLVSDGYVAMEPNNGWPWDLDGPVLRQTVYMTSAGYGAISFEIVDSRVCRGKREHVAYSFKITEKGVEIGTRIAKSDSVYSIAVVDENSDVVIFIGCNNYEKKVVCCRDALNKMLRVEKMYDAACENRSAK